MKKPYEKPSVTTDSVFETLALGCTYFTIADPGCDSDSVEGSQLLNS